MQFESDRTSISLEGNVSSKDSISIKTGLSWTATVTPATAAWLHLSKTKGEGNDKIVLTVVENNLTGTTRNATVSITSPGNTSAKPIIVTVAQTASSNWVKTFGGQSEESFNAVARSSDGGFFAGGGSSSKDGELSGNHGSADAWVVKVDANGNKVWQKVYGGSGAESVSGIVATQDGGCIFSATTTSRDQQVITNLGSTNIWLVRLDASGNIVWQKTFGTSNIDLAHAITASTDGKYIVAGATTKTVSYGFNDDDFYAVKFDGSGNIVWEKTIVNTSSYRDRVYGITASPDGGCVLAGETMPNTTESGSANAYNDALLVKLDGAGNEQWQTIIKGSRSEQAQSITTSKDGGYIVAGHSQSVDGDMAFNTGQTDYWVAKVDQNGNKLWVKMYGGSGQDEAHSIVSDPDGYIIAGSSNSSHAGLEPSNGANDFWIIKINEAGNMLWQKSAGGSKHDRAYDLTKTNEGDIIVAGHTQGMIKGVLERDEIGDGLLVKLKQ